MIGDCSTPVLDRADPGHIPSAKECARRTYLRSLLARLPDPDIYLWRLPSVPVEALSSAYRSRRPETSGQWRVASHLALDAFAYGLCDRDGFLTNYGLQVRAALLEAEQ